MSAKAKVIEDLKLPHAKSVSVKRFKLSLQLPVLQHEVMKPSVTEESLATKLCKVFLKSHEGIQSGPGIYISGTRRDSNLSDLDACALLETLRPSSRLWGSGLVMKSQTASLTGDELCPEGVWISSIVALVGLSPIAIGLVYMLVLNESSV